MVAILERCDTPCKQNVQLGREGRAVVSCRVQGQLSSALADIKVGGSLLSYLIPFA